MGCGDWGGVGGGKRGLVYFHNLICGCVGV